MKNLILLLSFLLIALPAVAKQEDKAKKQKALPPGLEKKLERTGELPPGWQKKLVKGEVLDPYLDGIAIPVTDPERRYFPSSPPGTEILRIENRIIRIKRDTREILDILGIDANF